MAGHWNFGSFDSTKFHTLCKVCLAIGAPHICEAEGMMLIREPQRHFPEACYVSSCLFYFSSKPNQDLPLFMF